MAIRSRITVRLDEDRKIIVFRVLGDVDGAEIVDTLMKTYAVLNEPWHYHLVLDISRHDGLMHVSHIDDLRQRWQALAGDYHNTVRGAIITHNPVSFARIGNVRTSFKNKNIYTFREFKDGMAWVEKGELPNYEMVDALKSVANF
ncbi:hypothetical protein OVA03_01535 [Asticcacaulis sp. SL142]|jgi:hypothetical protein|uniref:hypothetical protein n=1 Tax=Asticcacaulis sp. SL142 TaxID=2995155 RepID=UPI00226C7803|nr:hypothetical protein [Asticcacaulis sp. SL142]WAC48643.1 hypothetical protein OVA03_01535 [Asticcacaulis sp. SL142]